MNEQITDRRIQRTRQLLLDALRSLILEKGYEAMTVQDVIDRANIGDEGAAREVASGIEAAGGRCRLLKFDVADEAAVRAVLGPLLEEQAPAVLVNNAGFARDALFVWMTREEWRDTLAVTLDGFFLSDRFETLDRWAFPSNTVIGPNQFLVVWLDGEPGESTGNELHANFRLAPTSGVLALSRLAAPQPLLLDYLAYDLPIPGQAFGCVPDGQRHGRRRLSYPTPGGTNNPAAAPIRVRVNEWMADNAGLLADPADGDFEDWFELFNTDTEPVDLGGCTLTDNLTNRTLFRIPDGTVIGTSPCSSSPPRASGWSTSRASPRTSSSGPRRSSGSPA